MTWARPNQEMPSHSRPAIPPHTDGTIAGTATAWCRNGYGQRETNDSEKAEAKTNTATFPTSVQPTCSGWCYQPPSTLVWRCRCRLTLRRCLVRNSGQVIDIPEVLRRLPQSRQRSFQIASGSSFANTTPTSHKPQTAPAASSSTASVEPCETPHCLPCILCRCQPVAGDSVARLTEALWRFNRNIKCTSLFIQSAKYPISGFTKIRPVGVLIHADGRTDITKPRGNFRDYANAPKNAEFAHCLSECFARSPHIPTGSYNERGVRALSGKNRIIRHQLV
jgi:hypothetical protein